ncbi:MAG: hypothetical protein MJ197_03545 [Bacteroidales bacterium]|nr:hypothetical protein [Bacteroidales bacterium]
MEAVTIIQIISIALSPITGIATWIVSRRVRDNNTLNDLQKTIDMLVDKNNELINEITELRQENAELKAGQAELKLQIESLKKTKHQ